MRAKQDWGEVVLLAVLVVTALLITLQMVRGEPLGAPDWSDIFFIMLIVFITRKR